MLLSFKIELKPNNKQTTLFRKASGIARHAYNWACATVQECLASDFYIMAITTLIKSIQDIMRKDVGVDGDAQRISQPYLGVNNIFLSYLLAELKQNFISQGAGAAQPNISSTPWLK